MIYVALLLTLANQIRLTNLEKNDEELTEILKTADLLLDDPSLALHNTFKKLTKKNPRHFLELKNEFKPKLDDNCLYIGIHIRGGDILGGDGQEGREIHAPDYYKKHDLPSYSAFPLAKDDFLELTLFHRYELLLTRCLLLFL